LGGTCVGKTEADWVTGGLVTTLVTNRTLVADDGTFAAARAAVLAGFSSDSEEATDWIAEVAAKEPVASVVRTDNNTITITWTAATAIDITAIETVLFTLPASVVLLQSEPIVASPTFTVSAFGLLFNSDFSTGTGSSEAVLKDGAWTDLLNNGNAMEVVASTSLDFPSTNVLKITAVARGTPNTGAYGAHCMFWTTDNLFEPPAVGESLYYRWYLRMMTPDAYDATAGADHQTHGTQDADAYARLNWMLRIETASNGTFDLRWQMNSPAWPNNMWTLAGLSKETTYRIELRVHRTSSTEYQLQTRIYNSSDTLLYDEDDFENLQNAAGGLGSTTFTFTDSVDEMTALRIGLNDLSTSGLDASDYGFIERYQGCVAIRSDDWCGPYAGGI